MAYAIAKKNPAVLINWRDVLFVLIMTDASSRHSLLDRENVHFHT
jgi:hypothetical protein